MLYPCIPSPGVALETQEGTDLRGCLQEDTVCLCAHACSPRLQEQAWGSGIELRRQRADSEREQKAGLLGLWVRGKRRELRTEGEVETQGQRTNRQTLLSAAVSGVPAQHSHLQPSSLLQKLIW